MDKLAIDMSKLHRFNQVSKIFCRCSDINNRCEGCEVLWECRRLWDTQMTSRAFRRFGIKCREYFGDITKEQMVHIIDRFNEIRGV